MGTVIARFLDGLGVALPVVLLCAAPAAAQYNGGYPPTPQAGVPGQAPGAAGRNPACWRLESQLAILDRGGGVDPARAAEIKRYDDATAKQQAELDRLNQQSQRLGCSGGGFFSLFSGQSPQCGPLNNQIQQVRANLDRNLSESQRLQGNSGEREGQRRGLLVALGQNDCGPQYRQYANAGPGGFFEQLFGVNPANAPDAPPSGTYRTVCVRTCDGYFFPVSYSTVPSKFADDDNLCRRLCPATEAQLYTYRNPGEDIARAVSLSGRQYTELPNAFSYRKQYNAACSCRAPGQSWADALRQGDDQTLERGDIVVTEERAKQLSQPRVDAQGKPISLDASSGRPNPKAANGKPSANALPPLAAPAAIIVPEAPAAQDPAGDRKVRAVGPTTSYTPR
jgi:hypothetical protein